MCHVQITKWFRNRQYLHFDHPLQEAAALKIVTDPVKVARHAFYPFIQSVLCTPKISRDKKTKKLIRKKKQRDVASAAHVDSHIYAYYSKVLGEAYEQQLTSLSLQEVVLAFRSLGKSNVEFAKRAFDAILAMPSCEVVALDIEGFFDNLDHALLKSAWARVLGTDRLPDDHFAIFKSLTKWAHVDKSVAYKALGISIHNPKKGGRRRLCLPGDFRKLIRDANLIHTNNKTFGIPQGSAMSALLSNIYMLRFDEELQQIAISTGSTYFRYCDDIILICPTGKGTEMKAAAEALIQNEKLKIQHGKTVEVSFVQGADGLEADKPLQYLGFTFDGQRFRIRSSSVSRYVKRMRAGIRMAARGAARKNRARVARGQTERELYRKELFRLYSPWGRRNFLSYGFRSARGLQSESTKQQTHALARKFKSSLKELGGG
jgi:RNA-directed DNA polymerase